MSINWPKPSVTNVPEYQLSGLPYCLTVDNDAGNAAIKKGYIDLPRVSRWICFSAKNVDVDIFFVDDETITNNALNSNVIHNNQSFKVKAGTVSQRLEIRCKKIFYNQTDNGVAGTGFSIIAGLTHIDKLDGIDEKLYDWVQ